MSRFSPQFLDELRARTLLSTLVGRTIKLTRAGREWKACCPFHHEKSASFYVNDDKGFYHCFGCSAHGDAIRWQTEQRGLAFVDAVKELADAAGLALPAPDLQAAAREVRAVGLHEVMAAAAAWFGDQLADADGAEARAYLTQRGLSPETVTKFAFGYAPDRRDALKTALARFGDDMLVEAGLLIKVDDRTPYDRFRGRLMIPIRDPRGRVIAFGGRILGAGEPKYLNSPETPLFDKGRTLFNLDRAAAAARTTGRLIVVEGYFDVIALDQAGIGEAVAPLGTALTEAQLDRLWRCVDVPVLCFDGDAAGRKAAVRAAERAMPLLAPGRTLSIAMLPAGRDPDDVVRSGGRSAFDPIVEDAVALVDLMWDHEFAALPLTTPEARAGLKRRLNDRIATIADSDVRDQYRETLRARFDAAFFAPAQSRGDRFPRKYGHQRGVAARRSSAPDALPGRTARAIGGAAIDGLYGRAIMAGLLRHPSVIATCADALAMIVFADPALDRLRSALIERCFETGPVDSPSEGPIFQDEALMRLVAGLQRANGLAFSFTRGEADPDVARRDLAMVIEALASRPELDAALEAATARLATMADADGFAEQVHLIAALAQADHVLAALSQGVED